MTTNQNFSEITGYISVIEAARRLGVDPKRVYTFIEQGRLSVLRVAHATFVSEESVEQFELKSATGRPRKQTPPWRESPSEAMFLITVITVPVCEGQQGVFMERLRTMRQQKQHLFHGTVDRYISEIDEAAGTIEMQLVWKQSDMPGEAEYKMALDEFKETFRGVLDWEKARYSTKTVLLHT
jgi:hypothetical protein